MFVVIGVDLFDDLVVKVVLVGILDIFIDIGVVLGLDSLLLVVSEVEVLVEL